MLSGMAGPVSVGIAYGRRSVACVRRVRAEGDPLLVVARDLVGRDHCVGGGGRVGPDGLAALLPVRPGAVTAGGSSE